MSKLAKEFEAAETSGFAASTIDANLLGMADDYGLSSTAARYLPREVTLIATSIDRKPQYESVIDFVEDHLASPGWRPSLIVLHGGVAELHDTFVRSCESGVQDKLGEPFIPFCRCDWPPNDLEVVLGSAGMTIALQ